jgi:hypothetical protein
MSKIRVTRFSRHTRYAVLVPNEQPFDYTVIARQARPPKKSPKLAVQLRLPGLEEPTRI